MRYSLGLVALCATSVLAQPIVPAAQVEELTLGRFSVAQDHGHCTSYQKCLKAAEHYTKSGMVQKRSEDPEDPNYPRKGDKGAWLGADVKKCTGKMGKDGVLHFDQKKKRFAACYQGLKDHGLGSIHHPDIIEHTLEYYGKRYQVADMSHDTDEEDED